MTRPLATLTRGMFGWTMLLTVVAAPTQWSLRLEAGPYVGLADLLILAAALPAWCLGWRPWRLHWSHWAFAGWILVAGFFAASRAEAAKEFIQVMLYFILGSSLAAHALRIGGQSWLRRGLLAFAAVGGIVLALALVQYWFGAREDPLAVRGSFGNRNVFGGFLALYVPLIFGFLLSTSSVLPAVLLGLVVGLALLVCLSGPAWMAIALTCMVLAARRGWHWFVPTCILILLLHTQVLPRMPRANDIELFDSMALYDNLTGKPKRRYPEWQAAAIMAMEHPLIGCGPGSYQEHVGPYYGVVPNATGPAEPDIQNLYLVLASSAGWPAAILFVVMLATAISDSTCLRTPPRPQGKEMFSRAGVGAALAAFALVAIWHPLLVRGLGLPLAMLLAVARSPLSTDPSASRIQP